MAEAAEAAPETDHPAPDAAADHVAPDAAAAQEPQAAAHEPQDVARSAARKLVSGAIGAAKASALEDEDLAASLRICTLDGVAADDDADGLLARLAEVQVAPTRGGTRVPHAPDRAHFASAAGRAHVHVRGLVEDFDRDALARGRRLEHSGRGDDYSG